MLGAIAGALLLELVFMNGFNDYPALKGLGSDGVQPLLLTADQYNNGNYAAGYGLALLVEVILTFIFVLVVLGATAKAEDSSVAGLIIGGGLTFVHLIGIPLTGTSVNPARSIGPALIALINGETEPIKEIWIFILAPLVGAALAAYFFKFVIAKKEEKAAKA